MVTSGSRILFLADNFIVARRSSMALKIISSLGGVGSLKLPCRNHLMVSAIRTLPVEGINILNQR